MVHPARELSLPFAAEVSYEDPQGEWVELGAVVGPAEVLSAPPHRRVWISPRGVPPATELRAVSGDGAHGLHFVEDLASLLPALTGAAFESVWGGRPDGAPALAPGQARVLAALPRLACLRLWGAPLGPAALAELARAPGLSLLELDCGAERDALRHLRGAPELRLLSVRDFRDDPADCASADDELAALAAGLPGLRELDLTSSDLRGLGDHGIAALARHCRGLRLLRMAGGRANTFTLEGLEPLRTLPLESLGLHSDALGDEALSVLGSLELRALDLGLSGVTRDGLARFIPDRVEELGLQVPPGSVGPWLDRLHGLRMLRLALGSETVESDLAPLGRPARLEHLWMFGYRRRVTADPLLHLAPGRAFRSLAVHGLSPLSARVAAHLLELQVRHLAISDCSLGDDALALLAEHPGLARLALRGGAITDHGIRALARARSLRELDVDACPGVSRAELERLAETVPRIRHDGVDLAGTP